MIDDSLFDHPSFQAVLNLLIGIPQRKQNEPLTIDDDALLKRIEIRARLIRKLKQRTHQEEPYHEEVS